MWGSIVLFIFLSSKMVCAAPFLLSESMEKTMVTALIHLVFLSIHLLQARKEGSINLSEIYVPSWYIHSTLYLLQNNSHRLMCCPGVQVKWHSSGEMTVIADDQGRLPRHWLCFRVYRTYRWHRGLRWCSQLLMVYSLFYQEMLHSSTHLYLIINKNTEKEMYLVIQESFSSNMWYVTIFCEYPLFLKLLLNILYPNNFFFEYPVSQ